jgi:hypothetical protein
LTRGALEAAFYASIWEAAVAVSFGDFSGNCGANRAVHIADLVVQSDRLALFDGFCGVPEDYGVQRVVIRPVVAIHYVLSRTGWVLRHCKDCVWVYFFGFWQVQVTARAQEVGAADYFVQ